MDASFLTNSVADLSPLGGVLDRFAAAALPPAAARSAAALAPEVVPGEILVQYKPSVGLAERRDVRALVGGLRQEVVRTSVMQRLGLGPLERLALPGGQGANLQAAIEAISRNPDVAYAEPNYIYHPAAISNDPYYANGGLWGMYGDDLPAAVGSSGTTNIYGIQAEKAWNDNITGSPNVVVGIIDEGMQVTHPDLVSNVWTNPYDPVDGVDNDGNGYVDDVNGWDFVHNDNSVYDWGEDAHGTHVAGTIGGDGGNGQGVAGVNWDVKMISAKFLGPDGGTTADAVRALDYLTDLKSRHGINLVASNNSWGGGGYSQALHDAIIRSAKQDILFVAAAGNSTTNNDTTDSYPSNYNATVATSTQSAASYDNVIAVASITSTGAISSFSSYGAATVDLGAPGSGINSTVPTNSYANYSGTSMATPHVTGAAALFASLFPAGVSAQAIRSALLNSATPTASLAGKTVTGGRLNVYAALAQADSLKIDSQAYSLPSSLQLTVNHRVANISATAVDTIAVSVSSTTESTPETVLLTETGVNTGRFTGSIQLEAAAPVADGRLQAANGDQIIASYAALNQTVSAVVDAQPPQISAVSATAKASTSQVVWSTNEMASSEVLYGTSPTDLSRTVIVPGMSTAHAAVLTGLSPLTKYYYQVRSRDGAGNLSTDPTLYSFTTTAKPPILFVDDDLGASYERFYQAALDANGYAYATWDTSALGVTPSSQDLAAYKAVIWNTGFDYSSSGAGLTSVEQSAIAGYLDAGGRIYLSGQDILYNGVADSFLSNYLKIASYSNDVRTVSHTETGVVGNPISAGQSLAIAAPSDFTSLYVDALAPVKGAQGLFLHGVNKTSLVHSSVNYRGDYAAGGFGMVFTSFPFEAVSTSAADPNNQKLLLKRILEYLGFAQAGVHVTLGASAQTSEAGGSTSFSLSLSVAPSQDVTIPLTVSDATEATLSAASLLFTPSNWSSPQQVTVSSVDDAIDDGDVTYLLQLGALQSLDPAYNGLDPADYGLTNVDNDTAGITVSTPSGTSTSEAGGTVSFNIVLTSEPLAAVTIPLSSSNTAEATIGPASLLFSAADWNVPQTVTVSGVDDLLYDGNKTYNVVIAAVSSSDALYSGRNPADLTLSNLDNELPPATKFFVVNDASPDRTYEYATDGFSVENYALAATNTAPRGIATNADGSITWVVDSNRRVYVYNNSGQWLGDWLAGGLPSSFSIEGIATDGVNVWILEAKGDRLYYYANAASLRSGSPMAAASYALSTANGNTTPKDIVYGKDASNAGFLWVINDASSDRAYRYSVNAANGAITHLNNWLLNSNNKVPTGVAVDPAASSGDLWVVNNGSPRQIFRYVNGRGVTGSTPPSSSVAFTLNSANGNPQGLADPSALPVAFSGPDLLLRQAVRGAMAELGQAVAHPDVFRGAVRRLYRKGRLALEANLLQQADWIDLLREARHERRRR